MKTRRGSTDIKHRNLAERKHILQVLETEQSLRRISCEKASQVRFLITSWRAFSLDDPSLN